MGQVVEDADDINQAIYIILATPKGTDPHRPEFASGLISWIDRPITNVTPHLIRETYDAILRWEPRIDVRNVEVGLLYEDEIQRLVIRVEWVLKDSAVEGGVEVTL